MIRSEGRGEAGAGRINRWELWNLRALFPEADEPARVELCLKRREIDRIAAEVYARDPVENGRLIDDAAEFLRRNPGLRRGLVASMHVGPYHLLPAPYMKLGLNPAVVLDRRALEELRPQAERYARKLELPGRIEWICTDEPAGVRRLLRRLGEESPVLVYLDGNGGGGGMAATREKGMRYALPGRIIRLQTGLAKLILRARCPVHGVVARWRPDGSIDWRATPRWAWAAGITPEQATRRLYDWGFAAVRAVPEQWSFWTMLDASSECFRRDRLAAEPEAVRRERCARFGRLLDEAGAAVRIRLAAAVEVWEGDILADVSGQRFWSAEGLRDRDLESLRWGAIPTVESLKRSLGEDWVGFHLMRLYVLGLIRIEGESETPAVGSPDSGLPASRAAG